MLSWLEGGCKTKGGFMFYQVRNDGHAIKRFEIKNHDGIEVDLHNGQILHLSIAADNRSLVIYGVGGPDDHLVVVPMNKDEIRVGYLGVVE
jgi:hypothetical protein